MTIKHTARVHQAIVAAGIAIVSVNSDGEVRPSNLQGAADVIIASFDDSDAASDAADIAAAKAFLKASITNGTSILILAVASVLRDELTHLRQAIPHAVTSVTRSGTVATITCRNAHGLSVGDSAALCGADQAQWNASTTVATVPTATTFTVTVPNTFVTPATGSISYTRGEVGSLPDITDAAIRAAINAQVDALT